ncbi:glycine cleavage system protein H [Candidatus Zixiibacteriota bacterium]
MTPFLVVAGFLFIATVRWFLQARQVREADAARALGGVSLGMEILPGLPPPQLLFHPGHTWVHLHENGLATIGVTDLASNFAGGLARVEIPRDGVRLQKGDSAWTLVSKNHRRIVQSMPIDGKVVAVNNQLLENPDLTQSSPYENGWILRVRPKRVPVLHTDFLTDSAIKAWFENARDAITARLSPALGTVAQDGGEWLTAFGDQLGDDEWENLKRDLFPV